MSIRSTLSSLVAGAVLIGLTGISSPAFAAEPTVSIDLTGSGCSSVSGLMIYDRPIDEYLETYWSDGAEEQIQATATCGGREFDVRWDQISLQADSAVELTIPNLTSIEFESKSGTYTSGWGGSCIDSTYRVASLAIVARETWGSSSAPRVTFTNLTTLGSDGSFEIEYPVGFNVMTEYPGDYDSQFGQSFYGQSDIDAGEAFSEKCIAGHYLSPEAGIPNTIDLANQTAKVIVNLNYEDGFDSSGCSWSSNGSGDQGYVQIYRGRVEVQGNVQCGDYYASVQQFIDGEAGGEYESEIVVPPLNLVSISGNVAFAQAECSDFDLTMSNSGSWDWEGSSGETEIDANGDFSMTIPSGPVNLSIYSRDYGFQSESESLCQIDEGNLGFVDEDLTGVSLVSTRDSVEVTLEQPNVNELGDTCTLYSPEDERLSDPEFPRNVVTLGADPRNAGIDVEIYCGESVNRTMNVDYTADENHNSTVTLKAPDIRMKTITGKFTVPKGFPAAQLSNLEIFVQPDFDVLTGRSNAWSYDAEVLLSVKKSQYTVTIPEGDYKFSIRTGAVPRKGCYVDTWYPNTTYQFAQGLRITSNTAAAPRLNLLAGGRIRGNATFDERITQDIDSLSDQVYNSEGVSYAWMAGDGTGVEEDGDFFVYQCLPPGEYFYQAGNTWYGVKSQFYNNANRLSNATPVIIPSGGGDSATLNMHFMPMDAGTLSGTVTDMSGNSLSDYTVVAYDRSRQSWRSSQSAFDGSFSITGLDTPGSYSLVAFNWNTWTGSTSSEYSFFPSNEMSDAVMINITGADPTRDSLDIVVNDSLTPTRIIDLYPWFADMNISAPAVDFDGMFEELLNGDVSVDVDNVQLVDDSRSRARVTDWSLDIDVNFNTSADDTAGAYGYPNGSTSAIGLGDLSASEDKVPLRGDIDLEPGVNLVSVTGNETGQTVVVPILLGAVSPTLLTTPVLDGQLKIRKKVTATRGVWVASPAVTKNSYQWMTCSSTSVDFGCKPIKGAKKLKLTIPSSAKKKYLALKTTATNGATSTVEIHSFGRVR